MIIVIDAYNLIKQVISANFVEDKLRQQFLVRLNNYAKSKKLDIKLIFDGVNNLDNINNFKNLDITYANNYNSLNNYSADDYIKDLIYKYYKNAYSDKILLVTSDRELLDYAKEHKTDAIKSPKFYSYLLSFEKEKLKYKNSLENNKNSNLVKFDNISNKCFQYILP